MQLDGVAPECLVTEGVGAERLPAFADQLIGMSMNRILNRRTHGLRLRMVVVTATSAQGEHSDTRQRQHERRRWANRSKFHVRSPCGLSPQFQDRALYRLHLYGI